VVLGDLDIALRLRDNQPLNAKLGALLWRSPELQLGRGVGKPSDVFAFGLVESVPCALEEKLLTQATVSLRYHGYTTV
jgi:hypothetical protein